MSHLEGAEPSLKQSQGYSAFVAGLGLILPQTSKRNDVKFHRVKTSMSIAAMLIVSAVVIMSCGPASSSRDTAATREIVTARRQLDDHMAQCTKSYGYDPDAGSKLGANVLGPGEREWRDCVYQGIEKYLIPRTLSPDVYRRAIAEDRKMTEAIAKGEMTRAQRQARVQQMLEEIDRVEDANRAKQEVDRLEMEMRQDMRRRSLSPLLR